MKGSVLLDQARNLRAIRKEKIEITVIVEIENRDSAQNGVDDRLFRRRAVIQYEPHAGLRLAILKPDGNNLRGEQEKQDCGDHDAAKHRYHPDYFNIHVCRIMKAI